MKKSITFQTKLGFIYAKEEKNKIIQIKFGKIKNKKPGKLLYRLKKKIIKFLNKKSNKILIPTKIFGNANQKKVWKEISNIKYGKTKSYLTIAKKTKLSPRYVGKICGQNNLLLFIPCHRVIRSDGKIGGFSAPKGIKTKKQLIELEKI